MCIGDIVWRTFRGRLSCRMELSRLTEEFAHCLNLHFELGNSSVSPLARFLSTRIDEDTCTIVLQAALTYGFWVRHSGKAPHLFLVTKGQWDLVLIQTFDWRQGSQALFSGNGFSAVGDRLGRLAMTTADFVDPVIIVLGNVRLGSSPDDSLYSLSLIVDSTLSTWNIECCRTDQ